MTQQNPLRFNVGFIVHETPGYARTFEFEYPSVDLNDETVVSGLRGSVQFSKTQQGILAEAEVSGTTAGECARCLKAFDYTLETTFTELYAFDARGNTESELFMPDGGIIDLKPLISDFLLINRPINPICQPDCKGLCLTCGIDRNFEDCDHEDEQIDPRLAKLKELLEAKNNESNEDAA